jgi:hypothetical protein
MAKNKTKIIQKSIPIPKKDMFNYRAISICIVVLLASILAYIGIAHIITYIYHPDIDTLKELAKSILIFDVSPEPVESLLFQVGVISIPLLILGFFFLFTRTKLKNIKWENYFNQLFSLVIILICLVLYFGYEAPNPNYTGGVNTGLSKADVTSETNFSFYFSKSVLANQLPVLFFFVVMVLGLMFIMKRFEKQLVEPKWTKVLGIVLVSVYACVYFSYIWKMCTFDYPWSWDNQYDLSPVYYPVTQSYAGTPNLTDGLSSNYGSFAWFLNPIFRIFGVSVQNFTTVMAVLIILTFSLTLIAMFRTVKSKILVILSFASILFLCRFSGFLGNDKIDPYFAIFPLRQIVPAIVICLASFYVYNKSKILYYITHILLAFSIIWNPEFGAVSFVAWIVLLCYLEFDKTDWKKITFSCIRHIAIALGSLVLAFSVFSASIYLKTGQMPDIMLQFYSIIFFAKLGYYTLPMTLIHPWNFVLIVYVIGLVYAIYALFDKKHLVPKTAFVLLLSIIGIGTFTYFQGRSHNNNLSAIQGPAIFLLAIFADTMWQKGKIKQLPVPFILATSVIVIMMSFSCLDLYRNHKHWGKLAKPTPNAKEITEKSKIEQNAMLIKSFLPNTTEKVFINTSKKYQALYFGKVGLKSAFNPGIIDIFTIYQKNDFVNKMLLDTFDVFLEPVSFYYPVFFEVNAATTATRSIEADNDSIFYLKKRKYPTLKTPFLIDRDMKNTILYEKFMDDTASLKRRIKSAVTGVDPLDWGSNLSVEMIFFSEKQVYKNATLFSNYDDSTGVWCLQGSPEDPNLYTLHWEGYGMSFSVEPNKWNYLAIEIHDLTLEIYLNGSNVKRYVLPAPIKSSNRRLTIGNRENQNLHFTGSISEILLSKNILTSSEIQQRWKNIQKE